MPTLHTTLQPLNYVRGTAINAVCTATGTPTAFDTGTNITITSTGRPIRVGLLSPINSGYIAVSDTGLNANMESEIFLYRDGVNIGDIKLFTLPKTTILNTFNANGPNAFALIDNVPAGTYTYELRGRVPNAFGRIEVRAYLEAYEL